jgi:hypothetical protein
MSDIPTVTSRKRWFFSVLAACLLVFQTSNVVHDLDVAAHDKDPECEICELFVGSSDDVDATPEIHVELDFATANVEFASFDIATSGRRVNVRQIRAPPLSS